MAGEHLVLWLCLILLVDLHYTTGQSEPLFLYVEEVEERDSNQTEQCKVGTDELNCLCGQDLRDSYDSYRKERMETCSTYEDIRQDNSQLSFCEETLLGLGYAIQVKNVSSVEDPSNVTTFSNSSELSARVRELEGNLEGFKRVLDRTIIGVLIQTEEDRCYCLDNYKKWLCTMLPVYLSTNSNSEGSGNLSSVARIQPCLSVCHKVLQSCPYYLPSQFQNDAEVIYGGYPAFDCPRVPEPDYAGQGSQCIGENGVVLHKSVGIITILSLTLYILAAWSVT